MKNKPWSNNSTSTQRTVGAWRVSKQTKAAVLVEWVCLSLHSHPVPLSPAGSFSLIHPEGCVCGSPHVFACGLFFKHNILQVTLPNITISLIIATFTMLG
jgi:hypothetical protein